VILAALLPQALSITPTAAAAPPSLRVASSPSTASCNSLEVDKVLVA